MGTSKYAHGNCGEWLQHGLVLDTLEALPVLFNRRRMYEAHALDVFKFFVRDSLVNDSSPVFEGLFDGLLELLDLTLVVLVLGFS